MKYRWTDEAEARYLALALPQEIGLWQKVYARVFAYHANRK